MRRSSSDAKVRRICQYCELPFEMYRCHLDRHPGSGKFCSRVCSDKGRTKTVHLGEAHPAWKGGRASYRQRAFRELGMSCQECGYADHQELLWVHHRNFKSRHEQDDHSLDNLEVLCIRCHLERHLAKDGSVWIGPQLRGVS